MRAKDVCEVKSVPRAAMGYAQKLKKFINPYT